LSIILPRLFFGSIPFTAIFRISPGFCLWSFPAATDLMPPG
jgi:hypothetical protein